MDKLCVCPPLLLFHEKLDTRDNVSFLHPFSPPWRETLPTIRVIELFRPSFSSYGDAMGKNRNGLKAAVTFPLPGGVVHPRLPSLEKNNVNYRVPRCEETRRKRRRKRKEREEKGSAWKRIMGEGWIFPGTNVAEIRDGCGEICRLVNGIKRRNAFFFLSILSNLSSLHRSPSSLLHSPSPCGR